MKSRSWIGIDLDGTLAEYHGWKGHTHIGKPIPEMISKVKSLLQQNIRVKIFTARAADPTFIPILRTWADAHGLYEVEITNYKDPEMVEYWDDRAVTVIKNSGKTFKEIIQEFSEKIESEGNKDIAKRLTTLLDSMDYGLNKKT